MLPNQKHPSHFHKKKYETFIILYGKLSLIDGKKKYNLKSGDKIDLKEKVTINFYRKEGCILKNFYNKLQI